MSRLIDLTGNRYGRLTVVSRSQKSKFGEARWNCLCDCGKYTTVYGQDLKKGKTKSCRCLQRECITERNKVPKSNHEDWKTRLYKTWHGMRQRIHNKNDKGYHNYGGRGISICKEWNEEFQSFKKWALSSGYSDDLTIDRIDVNGNYTPDNCRWATYKEQANNMRTNTILTYDNKSLTVSQWADNLGIKKNTILSRIHKGWDIQRVLTQPVAQRKKQ